MLFDSSIRPATAADVPRLSAIYNHYVAHSHATFELDVVSEDTLYLFGVKTVDGGFRCPSGLAGRRCHLFKVGFDHAP